MTPTPAQSPATNQQPEESAGETGSPTPKRKNLPLVARIPTAKIFEDDWRSRTSPQRPCPVILIHGTGETKACWAELGTELRELGYAVFAPDFGNRSTDSVAESAAQVGAYIDAVLTVTGARKAILVGHSQGGILARYWMHFLGGSQKVHQLICLSVPNHGTQPGGFLPDAALTPHVERRIHQLITAWFGPSGFEMLSDSPLIDALNANGDTIPGIHYSCISTRSDAIITPVESCFLDGRHCTNIYVQDSARHAIVMHEDMPYNKHVRALVVREIENCPPLDPEIPEVEAPVPFSLRAKRALRVLRG
ncbi:MAG: triacylglycerol lipase [Corynebacterium sp.]|uniref:esterase/lipase family protein n=1 Tax=Corynebacterium sp. TaxID=1720 RepID=UPI0026DC76B4|nr:triacylglycerol lipase [Corynebacterium sp.]MDO5099516.1 triacylglycerol lipase [Corynebacterium sp.]